MFCFCDTFTFITFVKNSIMWSLDYPPSCEPNFSSKVKHSKIKKQTILSYKQNFFQFFLTKFLQTSSPEYLLYHVIKETYLKMCWERGWIFTFLLDVNYLFCFLQFFCNFTSFKFTYFFFRSTKSTTLK